MITSGVRWAERGLARRKPQNAVAVQAKAGRAHSRKSRAAPKNSLSPRACGPYALAGLIQECAVSEYERWESRFSGADYAFGTAPNYFLASCKSLLPASGTALAVADGEGRNGVWLAQQGLQVTSLDFSPAAQRKAAALAQERAVSLTLVRADIHAWAYPADAFDVVVDIFSQVGGPAERARKWAGIRRALKSGGLLIVQGYTPDHLKYGTGGPKQAENMYTRAILEDAFGDFRDTAIVEEELDLHEGASHHGRSAVIAFTGRKP
jgi:SAM-dependent methyltransferase